MTREYVGKTIEKIFWSLPNMSKFSRIKTRKNVNIRKLNGTEKILLPKWNEPGFIPMSPENSPPDFIPRTPENSPPDYPPRSPENSPPRSPANSPPPPKSPSPTIQIEDEIIESPNNLPTIQIEDEIIEFPPNAKKCPIGYLSHTVKGKKMCKRKKTQKLEQ